VCAFFVAIIGREPALPKKRRREKIYLAKKLRDGEKTNI
jgi:hypothetical protein